MAAPDSRILVVDDMPTVRELVKQQLKIMGYTNIVEASDGEQGFKILQQGEATGPRIDIVISDWNMPKMSGLEFLRQVRLAPHWTQLPFILLTSEAERDNVTEAILAGVSQYIVKPFSAKSFEDKFRSAVAKHKT